MTLGNLQRPLERRDINYFLSRGVYHCIVPYGVGGKCIMAVVQTPNETVEGWYFTSGEWRIADSFSLSESPIRYRQPHRNGEVIFTGEDAVRVDELYDQTASDANSHQRGDPILSISEMDGDVSGTWSDCDHPRSDSVDLDVEAGASLTYCAVCGFPHEIERKDETLQFSTVEGRSFLEQASGTTTTPTSSSDLVRISESSGWQAHLVVGLFCTLAKKETMYAVTYSGKGYEAMLYLEDDVVKGLILWNHRDGTPILRQIYVPPTHRRVGIASRAVDEWYAHCCHQGRYLAESPNTDGAAVLEAAGHLPAGSPAGSKAKLAHSLRRHHFPVSPVTFPGGQDSESDSDVPF